MKRASALLLLGLLTMAVVHLLTPVAPLLALEHSSPPTAGVLLSEIRLPRTLLGLGYGFVLGMTGPRSRPCLPILSPPPT